MTADAPMADFTPTGIRAGRRVTGADVLARRGIAAEPKPVPSPLRFPDGAHFRIEIPSVEGPAVLRAVLAQASSEGITVNRVSQGSGAMLLSAAELAEMARIGADNGTEVSLFVGPREEWDVGSLAQSSDGPSRAGLIRGVRQLRYAIDDVLRGVDHRDRLDASGDVAALDRAGLQRPGRLFRRRTGIGLMQAMKVQGRATRNQQNQDRQQIPGFALACSGNGRVHGCVR